MEILINILIAILLVGFIYYFGKFILNVLTSLMYFGIAIGIILLAVYLYDPNIIYQLIR